MQRPEFLDHPPAKRPELALDDFIVKQYKRTMTNPSTRDRVGFPDYLLSFEKE